MEFLHNAMQVLFERIKHFHIDLEDLGEKGHIVSLFI